MAEQGWSKVSIEERLARIEQWLNDLSHRVQKLENAMYNDGVIAKLKVLEERVKQLSDTQKLVLALTTGTFLGILATIVSILLGG